MIHKVGYVCSLLTNFGLRIEVGASVAEQGHHISSTLARSCYHRSEPTLIKVNQILHTLGSQEVQVLGLSPLQDALITFLCPNNLVGRCVIKEDIVQRSARTSFIFFYVFFGPKL